MRIKSFLNLNTILFSLSFVVVMGGISPYAQAQSTSKRLEVIEKQITALQRKVFTPGSQFSSSAPAPTGQAMPAGANMPLAAIETRLSELETQLRQLTGRIEESNFQQDKLRQQMETMARDYEFRLKELERNGSSSASQNNGSTGSTPDMPVAAGSSEEILPEGSEEAQYGYAQKLVTTGQYAQAENALEEFLKRYPQSDLAGNAQYWLGQTYYVRKMYTKATRSFLEGYNNYPKSQKAPAFLLKIGMSLYAMGEKTDACDAYRELASRFPNSIESKNMRPSEENRAGCK